MQARMNISNIIAWEWRKHSIGQGKSDKLLEDTHRLERAYQRDCWPGQGINSWRAMVESYLCFKLLHFDHIVGEFFTLWILRDLYTLHMVILSDLSLLPPLVNKAC